MAANNITQVKQLDNLFALRTLTRATHGDSASCTSAGLDPNNFKREWLLSLAWLDHYLIVQ